MKKNVLYITYIDYKNNMFPGVETKIATQMTAMRTVGCSVDRINQYDKQAQFEDEAGNIKIFSGMNKRFAILNAVKQALVEKSYMVAYIRFQFFSEDVRQMVKLLHSHGARVLMEIPTFPYEGELHQQGKKGEIKLFCDRMYRKICAKYIDRFVNIGKDTEIYHVPCINVKNGFDFSLCPLRNVKNPEYNTVHMLAVASMMPWHGYDRLIAGMGQYYKKQNATEAKFILHLVGQGSALPWYRQMVKDYELEEYVLIYDKKVGKELLEIADSCDIAIGALAAFRAGLGYLSTLKSREYCAWGLPSVNATETDILPKNDPYVLYVPEDDSCIDMQSILKFYRHIYFESGKTTHEIAETIRKNARRQCDIDIVFKPVLDYIKQG